MVVDHVDDANMISPSLVHDALYESGGTLVIGDERVGRHYYLDEEKNEWKPVKGKWSKRATDILFRKMVKEYAPSVRPWKRKLIYWAVVLFGHGSFAS